MPATAFSQTRPRRVLLLVAVASITLIAVIAGLATNDSIQDGTGKGTGNTTVLRVTCGSMVITVPLPGNASARIIYNWTHSVEGTPIVEVYEATREGLVLVEARAQSFGAGHPYNAEEGGGSFTVEDGFLVYKNLSYNIGSSLSILAWKDYGGSLTIIAPTGEELECSNFYEGRIEIINGTG